jgi:hypothetical protein
MPPLRRALTDLMVPGGVVSSLALDSASLSLLFSSFTRPSGHDHRPLPMCGIFGGAYLTRIIWWSVRMADVHADQSYRLLSCEGEEYILSSLE